MNNFGERLHSARKLAGLSMDALVKRAGNIVTKQAISKYEKGTINPSSGVLIALAQARGLKPNGTKTYAKHSRASLPADSAA